MVGRGTSSHLLFVLLLLPSTRGLASLHTRYNTICEQVSTDLPETVTRLGSTVKEVSALAKQLNKDGGDKVSAYGKKKKQSSQRFSLSITPLNTPHTHARQDMPSEAKDVVSDAFADVTTAVDALKEYNDAAGSRPKWTRAVSPLRQLTERYGTAIAVFVAASKFRYTVIGACWRVLLPSALVTLMNNPFWCCIRYTILISIALLVAGVALLLPKVFKALVAAWAHTDDLTVFQTMDGDLQKRVRQLRNLLRLQGEVRFTALCIYVLAWSTKPAFC